MTLIKPLLTEKTLGLTAQNLFTFKVSKAATAGQIKEAVEKTFGVNVVAVRTATLPTLQTRSFRTGRKIKDRGFKRAYVQLKDKQTIDLFSLKD